MPATKRLLPDDDVERGCAFLSVLFPSEISHTISGFLEIAAKLNRGITALNNGMPLPYGSERLRRRYQTTEDFDQAREMIAALSRVVGHPLSEREFLPRLEREMGYFASRFCWLAVRNIEAFQPVASNDGELPGDTGMLPGPNPDGSMEALQQELDKEKSIATELREKLARSEKSQAELHLRISDLEQKLEQSKTDLQIAQEDSAGFATAFMGHCDAEFEELRSSKDMSASSGIPREALERLVANQFFAGTT